MRQFTLLTTDDRHATPQLATLVAQDDTRAVQIAWDRLMEREHRKRIEILDQTRPVDRVRQPQSSRAIEAKPDAYGEPARRGGWLFRGSAPPAWYSKIKP